jgi:hypothetical protein
MKYEELMKLGKDEVERLRKLYDKSLIFVRSSTNYQTGERHYYDPIPEGAVPVNYFSNGVEFLRMTPEFEKLSKTQLEQLSSRNNDVHRPPFWAFED